MIQQTKPITSLLQTYLAWWGPTWGTGVYCETGDSLEERLHGWTPSRDPAKGQCQQNDNRTTALMRLKCGVKYRTHWQISDGDLVFIVLGLQLVDQLHHGATEGHAWRRVMKDADKAVQVNKWSENTYMNMLLEKYITENGSLSKITANWSGTLKVV